MHSSTFTVYVCPGESCSFFAMAPGKCRSHPYPCRAMGPELVPRIVAPVEAVVRVGVVHPVQQDVLDFHQALDLTIGSPGSPAIADAELRADLILEEAAETAEAITGRRVIASYAVSEPATRPQGLAGAIDGLCDLLAVIYGAAVTFGIDLRPFWDEVHRTNMAKAGGPKREDGKQLKPEGWQPPDIAGLLERLYDYREEER